MACEYFQELYTPNQQATSIDLQGLQSGLLSAEELRRLMRWPSVLDKKDAVFFIGADKAPGADGIPAYFFQTYWAMCNEDIYKFVWDCYRRASIPQWVNVTLTLVPKQANIQHKSQLRPLSLCTTIYKVLAKTIVAKLKPLLAKIGHPNQASFIPGKNITDNIFIAQEILHRYARTTGKQGYFAWKIDLSKAYDRLRWEFIDAVLADIGVSGHLHQLIMDCISTVQYRVIVNGALSDLISPQCGIRQGDPLSPYIFVLWTNCPE